MEKTDEYCPVVFVSHGKKKGQTENIRNTAIINGMS
jgi:hypothetical protein